MRRRTDRSYIGRPAPLPSSAVPAAIGLVVNLALVFFGIGVDAGIAATASAFLAWTVGVLHERSVWRDPPN